MDKFTLTQDQLMDFGNNFSLYGGKIAFAELLKESARQPEVAPASSVPVATIPSPMVLQLMLIELGFGQWLEQGDGERLHALLTKGRGGEGE